MYGTCSFGGQTCDRWRNASLASKQSSSRSFLLFHGSGGRWVRRVEASRSGVSTFPLLTNGGVYYTVRYYTVRLSSAPFGGGETFLPPDEPLALEEASAPVSGYSKHCLKQCLEEEKDYEAQR